MLSRLLPRINVRLPVTVLQQSHRAFSASNFLYAPQADVAAIEQWKQKHNINVSSNCDFEPEPILDFGDLALPKIVLEQLKRNSIIEPTPIQSMGIAAGVAGKDIIGISRTASGKTLAFLLPAIIDILERGDGQGSPTALVMLPTRELAEQVESIARQYMKPLGLNSVLTVGGVGRGPQLRTIQRGVNIVIATPGRLNDFINSREIDVSSVRYLVLDEADRMLDMGFEPQIRQVVRNMKGKRQTQFYSATWPKEVQRLALDLCGEEHVHVTVGSTQLSANPNVKQTVTVVQDYEKEEKVASLMQYIVEQKKEQKTIIFTKTKRAADQVARQLDRNIGARSLHGDKSANDRRRILADFRAGKITALVATDVASRGLDVPDVNFVINYDFPTNIEDYVHRIGRTARGGDKTGVSVTFFTRDDAALAGKLVTLMEKSGQEAPDELKKLVGQRGSDQKRNRYRTSSYDEAYGGHNQSGYGRREQRDSNTNHRRRNNRWEDDYSEDSEYRDYGSNRGGGSRGGYGGNRRGGGGGGYGGNRRGEGRGGGYDDRW